MKDSFIIAWRSLWRGRTLWTLLAAVVAAHVFLPGLIRTDGTVAGRIEMHIRVVSGAVAALAYVVSLSLGCGSFAREREDELLPLSLVRPVSAFALAAGRWLAFTLLAALVFSSNAVLLGLMPFTADLSPGACRIHHAPSLPPAEVSAAKSMEAFLKSDKTPDEVKKAPRAAILALLTAKENERYEVVKPGKTISWPFSVHDRGRLAVRTRFSTLYNMKETLNGVFRYRGLEGVVSNSTQAVLEVPLSARMDEAGVPGLSQPFDATILTGELSFTNTGKAEVMLRPRRDIEILAPGDSFLANCLRATLEMIALAALFAAFGMFLSAALSRPVALFTATVLLAAAVMAPDAVSQFPDEFHATTGERVGLAISRAVTRFTAALSEVSPVSDLACGRAIPAAELAKVAICDFLAWPALFLSLAAFILRRKPPTP